MRQKIIPDKFLELTNAYEKIKEEFPHVEVLHEEPLIFMVSEFLIEKELSFLEKFIKDLEDKGKFIRSVTDGDDGEIISPERTSKTFIPSSTTKFSKIINKKFQQIAGFEDEIFEIQV